MHAKSDTDPDADISVLIKALGETDRRIEQLTAGEIDTVTDRDGRSFLLQHAQENLRQSGVERQAAILDALPANIVLLDTSGCIVSANDAWRRYANANGLDSPDYGVGGNYLAVCDRASGEGAADAARAAAGIRSVLSGARGGFSLEYPCNGTHSPEWFLMTVTPVTDRGGTGAVVMHLDVTLRKSNEDRMRRFGAAMDASPDGIYMVDRAEMRFVHVNDAGCLMHRLDREEILALKPWEILGGSREALERVYDDLIASGEFAAPQELLWSRTKGSPIWLEVRRHAQLIGGCWTIVVLTRDVTERREAQSRIAYLTRVYAVLSGINTLIVRVCDRELLFREACRIAVEQGLMAMAWIAIVDADQDKLVPVASAGMTDDFRAAIDARLEAQTLTDPGNSMPDRVAADGQAFVSNDSQSDPRISLGDFHKRLGIHSMAVFPLQATGKVFGVLTLYARETGFFHEEELGLLNELAGDVAYAVEHIEKQERLDYLAYYDELTGLANRHLFIERVGQYVRSRAEGGPKLAVCLLDLERFRNINDSLGRAAGDSLLRQVAQWLAADVGDVNIVARIDTDRFAVVMPNVSGEDAIARRLDKSLKAFLSHSFILDGSTYRVAAKLGVALYPDDGADVDTVFKHAEAALKKAKAGGDSYLFYAQKMTETVAGRLYLENQLRRALELDEYVLHYQPKVDANNGKLLGAEALIRWNDPLTGLVPPGRFIPILEEIGLIQEVGRWALRQALQDHRRWRHAGLPAVRIAVNLSPLQLRHRDFIAEMMQLIAADPCGAAGLELEITESLIMENVQLSIANLKAVRALGVTVAIDDFGTGFSSLSYLSKLPVDTVKIDRSFISDMVLGPEGLSLVSIIINLAHSLKLGVVAEGVETEEQSRLLRLLNCDEMQGFLFGKPVPAAEFEQKYLQ